jgi:hypothetical protein
LALNGGMRFVFICVRAPVARPGHGFANCAAFDRGSGPSEHEGAGEGQPADRSQAVWPAGGPSVQSILLISIRAVDLPPLLWNASVVRSKFHVLWFLGKPLARGRSLVPTRMIFQSF